MLFQSSSVFSLGALQMLRELIHSPFLPALPKEYQKIGKALQSLAAVFSSSGYQGMVRNCTVIVPLNGLSTCVHYIYGEHIRVRGLL